MIKNRLRVWCATLGCDKNLVDSEALLGRFEAAGFEVAAAAEQADIWVLNTCGFIEAAREDSLQTLQRLAEAKTSQRKLVVTGCWSQEHGQTIARRFPEVDLVAGVGEFELIVAACRDGERTRIHSEPEAARYGGYLARPLLTPPHVAFVKISEGCSCHCTFCRIPLIKGPLRSRAPEDIVREVRQLAERGVQEVQIVSQNTSDYGRDRGEDLLAVVQQLSEVPGLRWIRLLYLYAGTLTAETALQLLECPKVVPYLDLPVQHASPRILAAMRRPGDPAKVAAFFERLRSERPDLVLRTTLLLGFPGEQEQDIELLADFLARVEFDHVGTYRYSPEVNTPAASLPGRVPPEVVADREALLLDLQAEIALARQERRLGEVHDVIVDSVEPAGEVEALVASLVAGSWQEKRERAALVSVQQRGEQVALGRSYHHGYDLDGSVVQRGDGLQAGLWTRARFAATTPFDTWAVAEAVKRP